MNEKPTNKYIFEDQLEDKPEILEDSTTLNETIKIANKIEKESASFMAASVENREFVTNKEKPEIPVKVANVFKPYYTKADLDRLEELTDAYYNYVKNSDLIPISFIMASNDILNEIERIHKNAQETYRARNEGNFNQVLEDLKEALKEVNKSFCNDLVDIYHNVMGNIFGEINWENATLNGEYLEIKQSDIASPIIVVPAKPVDESKRKNAKVVKVKATAKVVEEAQSTPKEDPIHYFKSDRTVATIGIMELLRLPRDFYSYYEYLDYVKDKNAEYIDPDQLSLDLEEKEPDYITFRNNALKVITKTLNKYYPELKEKKTSSKAKASIEREDINTTLLDINGLSKYVETSGFLPFFNPQSLKAIKNIKTDLWECCLAEDTVLKLQQENNLNSNDIKFIKNLVLNKFVANQNIREFVDAKTGDILDYPGLEKQRKIFVSYKEWNALKGTKDVKEARKQVDTIINKLQGTSIHFKVRTDFDKEGKPIYSKQTVNLIDYTTKEIRGGVIVSIGERMAKIFCMQGQVLAETPEVAKIKDNVSYWFASLFQRYYLLKVKMNQNNNNVLTVKKMLESCPDLPKYEDIKDTGEISRRITQRFIDGLNKLLEEPPNNLTCEQPILKEWHFLNNKNKTVSIFEVLNMKYKEFENLKVKYTLKDEHLLNEFIESKVSELPLKEETEDTQNNKNILIKY